MLAGAWPKHSMLRYAVLSLCVLLLGWHAAYYYPFLADDALISLRYAERFLEGKGLTWNDGERVEGYTNFLWVIATAALGALGVELVQAARLAGALGTALLLFALWRHAALVALESARAVVLFAGAVFVAASPPVAAWVLGGLENSLLTGFLAMGVVELMMFMRAVQNKQHHLYYAGLWLGLMVLTRADAPLLVASLSLGLFFALLGTWREKLKAAVLLAVIPLGCFLLQLAFRVIYYGDLFPNTYYAKFALTPQRFSDGLSYVAAIWLPLGVGGLALGVAGAAAAQVLKQGFSVPSAFRRCLVLALPMLCHSVYVAKVGGDIFPAFRHGLVLIALYALIIQELVALAAEAWPELRAWLAAICTTFALAYFACAHHHPENERARHERWEWPCKAVAEEMNRRWSAQQPTIAVTAAGCMPFFSKLPALDMYGLNDRQLARTRPEGFGHGMMGHELMDADYVMQKAPDIIVFHIADSAEPEVVFYQNTDFNEQYSLYAFPVPGLSYDAQVWLRNDRAAALTGAPM